MNDNTLRRTFLRQGLASLGLVSLNTLLDPTLLKAADAPAAGAKGVVNPLHHPAKAKRVIFLYQAGGPSHLETFDYKPKLNELNMQPCPDEVLQGQKFPFLKGVPKLLGTPHKFAQHGKSGAWLQAEDNLHP